MPDGRIDGHFIVNTNLATSIRNELGLSEAAGRLGIPAQQKLLGADIRTKCANLWTFLSPKPDISDILTHTISDLMKLVKARLLRAFSLAMIFTYSNQMS